MHRALGIMYLSPISKQLVIPVVSLFVCLFSIFSSAASNDEISKRTSPIITYILLGDEEQDEVLSPFSSGSFLEQDGLIVVDMESLNSSEGWEFKTGDGAIGGYFEWTGSRNSNNPGDGLITLKVAISNPGTYRFIWRSSFREGTDPTESNDSWLRILANNFYGFRSNNDSIVCPGGQLNSNRCIGPEPNGSSRDGWFKVYRSGGSAFSWDWIASTSDNNAHQVYADFDTIGEYEIQISGRSRHHAIDRFVLFRDLNNNGNVLQSYATNSDRLESKVVP